MKAQRASNKLLAIFHSWKYAIGTEQGLILGLVRVVLSQSNGPMSVKSVGSGSELKLWATLP